MKNGILIKSDGMQILFFYKYYIFFSDRENKTHTPRAYISVNGFNPRKNRDRIYTHFAG